MKKSYLLLSIIFFLFIFSAFSQTSVKLWETDAVFWTPESIVFDNTRRVLYVSNFNDRGGFRKAGDTLYNECISKVDLNGNIVEFSWIDSLIGPTGLIIHKDTLYAVERKSMVIIDIENKTVVKRIPIPGAGFPNDITVDSDNNFYITDSSKKTIYKIKNGKVKPWLVSDEIAGPNGILYDEENLIVGISDNYLKSVNLKTKTISKIALLADGIIDGIKKSGNDYIVSHYEGNLYNVTKTGEITELLNTRKEQINCADFEYIENEKMLFIPALTNNKVFAYSYKKQ